MQNAAAAEIVTAHAIEDCNNYISDGIVPYASLYLKAQKHGVVHLQAERLKFTFR